MLIGVSEAATVLNRQQIRLLLHILSHSKLLKFNSERLFLQSPKEKGLSISHLLNPIFAKWENAKEEELNEAKETIMNEVYALVGFSKSEENSPQALLNEYHWAVFAKLAIQQGEILPDAPEIHIAMWIFIEQLKEFYHVYTQHLLKNKSKDDPILVFNPELVRRYFREFLGQLCFLNNSISAQIIHNFLHLAHQVWHEQKATLKRKTSLSLAFAPAIFEGLRIFQEMLKLAPGEAPFSKEEERQKNIDLYNFFQLIAAPLMGDKFFKQPFEKSAYLNYKQAAYAEEFQKVQARATPRRRSALQLAFKDLKIGEFLPPPIEDKSPKRRSLPLSPISPRSSEESKAKSPRTPRTTTQSTGSTETAPAVTANVIAATTLPPSSPATIKATGKRVSVTFDATITARSESAPELPITSQSIVPAFSLSIGNRNSGDLSGNRLKEKGKAPIQGKTIPAKKF